MLFCILNKNEIEFFLTSFEKWVAYPTSVKTFGPFFYSNGMCLYQWVVWQNHSRPIESHCQDDGLKSLDSHRGMKAVLPHFNFFWVFLQMVVRFQIKCNIGCAPSLWFFWVFLLCLWRGPILSPIPLQPVMPTGPSPSHFTLFIEMGWYLWVFYYLFFFFWERERLLFN